MREADHWRQSGEIGALLRREGLYWSNLITWRKQRERGELAGLSARKRGPCRGPRGSWSCKKKSHRFGESNWKRAPSQTDGDRQRRSGVVFSAIDLRGAGNRASQFYRWQRPSPAVLIERIHPRALSVNERQEVVGVVNSERFWDQAPGEVYAALLDERKYLCSERTMYRILAAQQQVRERRDQLRHPRYQAPELIATRQNEVWSWDITKFLGPSKWTYFYLYVILDIFSRYVVGWMLAYWESAELAKKLIEQTIERQGIGPGSLAVHADRGAPMSSKGVALLLAELGVRPIAARTSPTTTRTRRASSRP